MALTEREQQLLAEIEAGLLNDHRSGTARRWSGPSGRVRSGLIIGAVVALLAITFALSIPTGLTFTIAVVLLVAIARIHRRAQRDSRSS